MTGYLKTGGHMPAYIHLLRCVGKAAVKKAGKALCGLVPFGEVAYEVAVEAYEDYRKGHGEAELRAELERLVRATPEEVRSAAEEVAAASGEPDDVRQGLTAYLTQVPASARQSLRRPSDPGGTT